MIARTPTADLSLLQTDATCHACQADVTITVLAALTRHPHQTLCPQCAHDEYSAMLAAQETEGGFTPESPHP